MRMSKQIRSGLTAVGVAIALFVGFLQPLAAQRAAVPTNAARNAALIGATQDVLKETSEIRQLSILHPVQSSAQSRAEIERALIKNLDEDMSAAQIHASEV